MNDAIAAPAATQLAAAEIHSGVVVAPTSTSGTPHAEVRFGLVIHPGQTSARLGGHQSGRRAARGCAPRRGHVSRVVPNTPFSLDEELGSALHAAPRVWFWDVWVGSVGSVPEQSQQRSSDLEGERVRRLRLRADGRRSLAVNLEETILLTRKLFELRDAARRAC